MPVIDSTLRKDRVVTWLPRVMGALTAAYGAGVLVQPTLLARPCELTGSNGAVPAPVRSLSRAIGARDLASGVAMCAAPGRHGLHTAIAVSVASDLADAAVLGTSLPGPQARGKAAAAAGAWGALCALSARSAS